MADEMDHGGSDGFLAGFAARIRLRRVARGWTQKDLADAAGMHRTFIGQLERGRRGLNITALPALAAALQVTVSDLFEERR